MLVGDAIGLLKNPMGKKGIINLKKSIFLINNPMLDDRVFDGIVIQKQFFGQQMSDNLDNTKVILLKIDLKEIEESLVKEMKSYDEIVQMKERQKKMTKEISDSICKTGAGIVFMSSVHADEQLLSNLLEKNILMIHVSNEELLNIASALDVQVVRRKEDIRKNSVGSFKSVYYDEENGLFFLENYMQRKRVTIIIGGVTKVTSQERWRTVKDGISAAQSALNDGIVAGGGAVELCISEKLKEENMNSGVDSIGIEVVAHALSSIMRQILANAGFNGFEKMAEIRNKSGEYGIDISTGKDGC